MVYLITYDLNKSNKNYDGVFEAIKNSSTGEWVTPLKSVWIIKSNLSADEISEKIQCEADKDDSWLVIEVKKNSQGQLLKSNWEKIKELYDLFDD